MKSNSEILSEDIILNESKYSKTLLRYYDNDTIQDIIIDKYMLIRIYNSLSIITLHTGSKYTIPIEYYNIFTRFSFYNFMSLNENLSRSSLDKFIYYMSSLINYIEEISYESSSDKIIDLVNKISKCGTREFRDFIYNKLGIILNKIDYESINFYESY